MERYRFTRPALKIDYSTTCMIWPMHQDREAVTAEQTARVTLEWGTWCSLRVSFGMN